MWILRNLLDLLLRHTCSISSSFDQKPRCYRFEGHPRKQPPFFCKFRNHRKTPLVIFQVFRNAFFVCFVQFIGIIIICQFSTRLKNCSLYSWRSAVLFTWSVFIANALRINRIERFARYHVELLLKLIKDSDRRRLSRFFDDFVNFVQNCRR